MIAHGKSVVRSTKNAAVVVDMPFGTYEQSPAQAFANAERVLRETECDAVKLEGGLAMVPTIEFLIARGVPVMGHVGLYPQHSAVLGGFVKERDADKVIAEAKAQADAGVFCMVVEAVPTDIAKAAAMAVDVPVIGIAAGDAVDGQILVVDDLIGVNPAGAPPFVRQRPKSTVSCAMRSRTMPTRFGRFKMARLGDFQPDYVIVGAGSAGCVVADQLSRSGQHKVLVLEAGTASCVQSLD